MMMKQFLIATVCFLNMFSPLDMAFSVSSESPFPNTGKADKEEKFITIYVNGKIVCKEKF